MKGTAKACGAATIVNAIASGKGAAFGISLETTATVKINQTGRFRGKIAGHPKEDTKLIELCAKKVLEYFKLDYGADIETKSNIPIASGLKSSSTAANAAVLATIAAIKEEKKNIKITDQKALDIAVDAALEAKVTITGAFDDAAASYFGGYVVTDNIKRRIIKDGRMDDSLSVLIFAPDKKNYTANVDIERIKLISSEALIAWDCARKGMIYEAMKLNGLIYSAVLNQDSRIALAALEAGAITAGLSGKGPAVCALVKDDSEKIYDAWGEFDGEIIEAKINNKKAGGEI